MPKRCGDLAGFSFKVTPELVGKFATTMVCRKKKFDFAAVYTEKLEKEETKKVKWPDQQVDGQPEGIFCGGRKVDYKGLNKLAYDKKFEHQEFELKLYQAKNMKKSTGSLLKIEAYPDVGEEPKVIGIPMATEMWDELETTRPDGTKVTSRVFKWFDLSGDAFKTENCGNFHIEFKDGLGVITIKIELTAAPGSRSRVTAKMFKDIKKTVEEFWNSRDRGFFQWVYHRKDCKRGDKCNCPILRDKKGRFVYTGCCKVPLLVKLERGPDNPVEVTFLTLAQQQEKKTKGAVSGLRADTKHLYYPENNPGTFAHEVGHMLGFPDQYWYGVVDSSALDAHGQPRPGATFPIDDTSIMGQEMLMAKEEHIGAEWFYNWVNDKIDSMKPIRK